MGGNPLYMGGKPLRTASGERRAVSRCVADVNRCDACARCLGSSRNHRQGNGLGHIMAAKKVLTYLLASKAVLASLEGDALATRSRQHRSNLTALLSSLKLSEEEKQGLLEVARQIGWTPDDRDEVITAIASLKTDRNSMQDYTSILFYLMPEHWTKMSSTSPLGEIEKMHVVTDLAKALGCQNPTEPTYKRFTSIYLIASQGYAKAATLGSDYMNDIMKVFKRQFKATKSRRLDVALLPIRPSMFLEKCPEEFAVVYGSLQALIPTPPCELAIEQLEMLFQCRTSGRNAQLIAPRASLACGDGNVLMSMMAMMQSMMHGAPHMQAAPQMPMFARQASQPNIGLQIFGSPQAAQWQQSPLALGGCNSPDASSASGLTPERNTPLAEASVQPFAKLAEPVKQPASKRSSVAESVQTMLQHLGAGAGAEVKKTAKTTLKKPAAAKAALMKKPAAAGGSKSAAFYSHEASRNQFMGRLRKGGVGSSQRFEYGVGNRTKANAQRLAEKWVAEMNARGA